MWQDYVISTGQWLFALALIPSIRSKTDKPPMASSLMTAIILSIFAGTFVTLDLTVSAVSSMASALAWWILFFQKAIK